MYDISIWSHGIINASSIIPIWNMRKQAWRGRRSCPDVQLRSAPRLSRPKGLGLETGHEAPCFCFLSQLDRKPAQSQGPPNFCFFVRLPGITQRQGTQRTLLLTWFCGHFLINVWDKDDSRRIPTENYPIHLQCQAIGKRSLFKSCRASRYANSSPEPRAAK